MGFRCPKCKRDFDLDREALLNHFRKNEDCTAEAVSQYAKAMNKSLSNDDALSEDSNCEVDEVEDGI